MSDKGFAFQERDASTPKNNTSVLFLSEMTHGVTDNCFMVKERRAESFQERDSSSPKNNTAHFISGDEGSGTCGQGQGKVDIFGNAISNQRKRGAF